LARSKLPKPPNSTEPSDYASPVRIPKTAELIAAQIRKAIIRGEIKPGDFLPPEAHLMERFGISRPSLREAFRILESEQLISVSRGSRSGARVHAPSVNSAARNVGFALQAQGTLLSDIYLARLAVEPFAVRLAAERATAPEIARFRTEIDRVFAHIEREGSTDLRLPLVKLYGPLVQMSGSNSLIMIWAILENLVEQHMSRSLSRSLQKGYNKQTIASRIRAGRLSFRKVINLIELRDAEAAEVHWREHLRKVNAVWLLGYDGTAIVDVVD
jgi:DNA-binding FadR family transcriptional regulator